MTILEVAVSTGRLLLAVVFVAAAVGKLRDREGTRRALAEFGAPRAAIAPLSLLLPVAELGIAVLLLPTPTAVIGAAGALTLLLLFSAAIAASLARGRTPDCHCFGSLHSAPASALTLARNAALAGTAAFALVAGLSEPDVGTLTWTEGLSGAEAAAAGLGLALATVVAGGAFAYLRLLRSYGDALMRVEELENARGEAQGQPGAGPALGLEPGSSAPAFSLPDASSGERAQVSLDHLLARRVPVLLVFTSAGCPACERLLPELAGWQADHEDRLTIAVLALGDAGAPAPAAEEHGLRRVLVDRGGELYRAYEAAGTPSAVLVSPDGTIRSRVAAGPAAIEQLVAVVLDSPGLPLGAPAPSLHELAGLDGRGATLGGGRETLLLLWNPGCGFCRGMHEELLRWETEAAATRPALVVVSSGDEESARQEGFASPVVLDPGSTIGASVGARGTPSAVLVDADGRVASEVVAGPGAVMALAGGSNPSLRVVHAG